VRIVSLVPHATELLFALGLGDDVVAVTHECDFPPEARELPHVTRDVLEPGLSAREIDAAVRERTGAGEAIYALDEAALAELEPDLIVTQALCAVCAVSYDDVVEVAANIATAPQVISPLARMRSRVPHEGVPSPHDAAARASAAIHHAIRMARTYTSQWVGQAR